MLDWLDNLEPDLIRSIRPESRRKYLTGNPLKKLLVQRFLDKVLDLVRESGARTVLDAGCGEGLVDYYLLNNLPGLSIRGTDLDGQILHLPSRLNPPPRGKYLQADARCLPFPDSSFELVLSNEVLEHLPDYPQAIAEAARVSSNYCIFSVPQWPFYQAANLLSGNYLSNLGEHPDHVVGFSKNKLEAALRSHFKNLLLTSSFPWLIALGEK